MRQFLSTLALLAVLAPTDASAKVPKWSELPGNDRDNWNRLVGLEAGIAITHCMQPAAAAVGEVEWKPKMAVAIAGCAVYTTNTFAMIYRQKWGLWVNIIGPIVGITAVGTGWALGAAGVIDARIRPDTAQIAGGVLQVWAWVESFTLLSRYRKRGESMLRHADVVPVPGGAAFRLRW